MEVINPFTVSSRKGIQNQPLFHDRMLLVHQARKRGMGVRARSLQFRLSVAEFD